MAALVADARELLASAGDRATALLGQLRTDKDDLARADMPQGLQAVQEAIETVLAVMREAHPDV